jgi:predicted TIM-barrel fold metal-dependent hydrolase
VHLWDASPENIKNIHGKQFIDCFYGYHAALSPPDKVWTPEQFAKYSAERMVQDLFIDGPDDMAIFQPTYLKDFYHNGFNTLEQNSLLSKRYPNRFILNGAFDPRDGNGGLEALEAQAETYKLRGVKVYTAEWKGDSRGYKLSDPAAYKYLEKCESLGIKNVHVHKGPTIRPLDRDAFDVADIDHCATDFPNLNFIIEHCGLPRLDDFCWIATQESNVYGGLAVVLPFIHSRPGYFAKVISELLFWIGEDKILFGSDYGIWTPGWLVEKFMNFQLPDEVMQETGKELTMAIKRKILGENAARLYNVDIASQRSKLEQMDKVAA